VEIRQFVEINPRNSHVNFAGIFSAAHTNELDAIAISLLETNSFASHCCARSIDIRDKRNNSVRSRSSLEMSGSLIKYKVKRRISLMEDRKRFTGKLKCTL